MCNVFDNCFDVGKMLLKLITKFKMYSLKVLDLIK